MSKNIKFVDLFAGIGGFAAAFTSIGAECLLAVEKDKTAAETYQVNWGHFALGNVVDSNNPKKSVHVGPHDILAAKLRSWLRTYYPVCESYLAKMHQAQNFICKHSLKGIRV